MIPLTQNALKTPPNLTSFSNSSHKPSYQSLITFAEIMSANFCRNHVRSSVRAVRQGWSTTRGRGVYCGGWSPARQCSSCRERISYSWHSFVLFVDKRRAVSHRLRGKKDRDRGGQGRLLPGERGNKDAGYQVTSAFLASEEGYPKKR